VAGHPEKRCIAFTIERNDVIRDTEVIVERGIYKVQLKPEQKLSTLEVFFL